MLILSLTKGGINISRDILIIGEQRCGKTMLTNYILEKYNNYEAIRGDALEVSLSSELGKFYDKVYEEKKKTEEESLITEINKIILSSKRLAPYFKSVYNEIKIDLSNLGKSVIIDTCSLDVKDAIKYFRPYCDIYCLGMPNESTENLNLMIRKNDTMNDWTYSHGDTILNMVCNHIIQRSKQMQEECKKYDVKFFDTSGNRKEKIEEIIKEIEKNSINKD